MLQARKTHLAYSEGVIIIMTIKTITVSGITSVSFNESGSNPYFYVSERYAWIKNKSSAVMYASLSDDVGEGVSGTTEIPSGEASRIELDGTNRLFFSGEGSVEIKTSSSAVCPFNQSRKGGDGGNDITGELTLTGHFSETITGQITQEA